MKLAAIAAVAIGAATIPVTALPRPPFSGPVTSAPAATRLVVVSSRKVAPGYPTTASCSLADVPSSVRGLPFQRAFCPGGRNAFALYGRDGASARLLFDIGRWEGFDFMEYARPPRVRQGERGYTYEQVVWARKTDGALYVEHAHPTYARSSYGQNAYITALDVETKRRLWRSKALVANARTFAVTPQYLVTGYGFTDEDDWLYLLDRRTGRVVERLALPSAPERITRGPGGVVNVRTYDHAITVRLRES
jgi:hypothetical protein